MIKNDDGVPEDEENFDEAIKNVNTALNQTKVSDPKVFYILSCDYFGVQIYKWVYFI